jgi:hypothetical protein
MRYKARILGSILPVALLTLGGGFGETRAATYYLDGSCQYSGNGLADQCASAAGQPGAKKTGAELHAILDAAACGDTIIVKAFSGTYSNQVSRCSNWECGAFDILGKTCNANNKLTLKGADRNNKPKLCHYADCLYHGASNESPVVFIGGGSDYVVIDGLAIDGRIYAYQDGNGGLDHEEIAYNDFQGGEGCDENFNLLYMIGTSNGWVHHNYFHDMDTGSCSSALEFIVTYRDDYSVYEYNTFRKGTGSQVKFSVNLKEAPYHTTVRYNDIEGGIRVNFQGGGSHTSSYNAIYGNIFHVSSSWVSNGNLEGVRWCGGSSYDSVHHNTFVDGSNYLRHENSGGGAQTYLSSYDNLFVKNSYDPSDGDIGACAGASAGFSSDASVDWAQRGTFNYHHNVHPGSGAKWCNGGTGYTALTNWQAAGIGGGESGSQTLGCAYTSTGFPGDWRITGGACKTASSTGGEVGAYGCTTCTNYTGCVGHTCGATPPAPACGNGVKEGTEVCDGGDLGGATCSAQGFYCGTLQCNSSCTGFVTTSCVSGSCGDGQIQSACGEACDGSALGGQTCQGLGYDGGTLTCSSGCALVTSACTSAAPSVECANWQTAHPDWIWCDDFEYSGDSALLSAYDDSGVAYSSPLPAMGVSSTDHFAGSKSLRFHYVTGAVDVGYLWRHFGRNPAGSNYSNTTDFSDVYWRFYMKLQTGWTGQPQKITRGTGFYRSDRSQTFVAHFWQDQNPQGNGTSLDPVSCVSGSTPACSGYNNLSNFTWLGERDGADRHVYDTANAGVWRCMEFHAKLNTPGASDGVQEYWIDGGLQARRSDLNFRGNYTSYGINAVQLEAYWNAGAVAAEDKYYDNFVISRQRIGCASAPADTTPPANVQNATRTDTK